MNPWLEAARHYSSLDEAGRQQYWSSLTTEQQAALSAVLSTPKGQTAAEPTIARADQQVARPSVLATLSIGCAGFILGIVLTIALEVLAVAAGMQGAKSLISSATGSSGSTGSPSTPVIACDQYPEDSYEKRTCLDAYNRMVEQNTHPAEEP